MSADVGGWMKIYLNDQDAINPWYEGYFSITMTPLNHIVNSGGCHAEHFYRRRKFRSHPIS